MADTYAAKKAQAQIVELRAKLHEERAKRRQVEANAIEARRTLSAKIERLERGRAAVELDVREARALVDGASEGDVFRQRLAQLEFGVGCIEVGPVPDGVDVVVRVPPGTTSGRVMSPLRELACLVADDQVPLDPRRGAWELVRAGGEVAGGRVDGELALALDEARAALGGRPEVLPELLREVAAALRERAQAGEEPAEAAGEGAPAEASSGAQEGAASADGGGVPSSTAEAAGEDLAPAPAAPVEGSRRRRISSAA